MSGQEWVVLKFGGTSVASRPRWEVIAAQARARQDEGLRPLLVCSAAAGVSDLLQELPDAALLDEHPALLDRIAAAHEALCTDLEIALPADVGDLLDLARRLAEGVALVGEAGPRVRARVLSLGERMSTAIGRDFLLSRDLDVALVDVRDHLVADRCDLPDDKRYLDAVVSAEPDFALREAWGSLPSPVLLTQGFLARRPEDGATCLLGRGGSDTSASVLAARLGAVRCEIWTDVPGMFTANPRQVPSARLLTVLDFAEAQEIATTGAKVLHPRAIPPVRAAGIPLHMRCTPEPDLPGTVVGPASASSDPTVKAVSLRKGVVLVSMETVGMWQQVGFLADAFAEFKKLGLSIDLVATSETSVTVSLDPQANPVDAHTMERLMVALDPLCRPKVTRGCASVSLVGRQIRSILHRISGVFELFEEQRVHLLSQAASDLNLTVVVDEDQADRLAQQLHARVLQELDGSAAVGPSWSNMVAPPPEADGPPCWWQVRRAELLAEAERASPVYVYDAAGIERAARDLAGLQSVRQVLYAMKANPHPELLRIVRDAGLGFECVSVPEVERAAEILAETGERAPILFTPNFAAREEYERGYALGARVTLDNLHPVEHWPELFRDREAFVRIDPGHGHGHHAHVRTGGSRSKFGVSLDQLDRLRTLAERAGLRITGLHAHVGSGVRDPHAWTGTGRLLCELADSMDDVRTVDLGGGLGVPEKPGQEGLDLTALDRALAEIASAHPGLDLWLEPGRYLVATAGVLLARVTQLKSKGSKRFVGVDAGMNSLIRPALYGAWHEIVNLSREGEAAPFVEADVVGPICETGDALGHDRRLAEPREGDVLLVATAGAYGRAMASHYNLREPAREVVL